MNQIENTLDLIKEECSYLAEVIDKIGFRFKGRQLSRTTESFIILFNRMMCNLYSISVLIEKYKTQPISNSLSLLFRSCISDMIIGFYLLTFKGKDPEMENEIRVLDSSFLKYVKKVSPLEQEILSKDGNELEKRLEENEIIVNDSFQELLDIDEQYKVLNARRIREKFYSKTSEFEGDLYKSNLSEEKMFEFLISKSKTPFASLYIYYRFFSQFQHFTHAGKELFHLSKSEFSYYFLYTLVYCYNFVIIINSEILEIEVIELEEHFEKVKNVVKNYRK